MNAKLNGLARVCTFYKDIQEVQLWCGDFQYDDEILNGIGTCSSEKYTYLGYFKNLFREGIGRAIYHEGTDYVGQWKDSKKNGKGILTQPDGTV